MVPFAALGGRRLLLAALVAATFAWAVPASADEGGAAISSVLAAQPLGPTTYLIAGAATEGAPVANGGFVVTATSVVVVGAPESAEDASRWLEAIRAVTPKPVSHVLLTGADAARAGGVAALKANGAAVVARRLSVPPSAPAATGDAAGPPHTVDLAASRIAADLWLEDSTDLLFGGVHLLALALEPVHGPHDMAYVVPDDGVLFAGDLLVTGRLPDVRDADAGRWLEALGQLQQQGAGIAVPSHGPVSRSPQEDFERARDYLSLLRGAMVDAARNGTPFDEAYARGDWGRYAELPMFDAVNRANARHTYLQAQGTPP